MEHEFIAALAAGVMVGNVFIGRYIKKMSWEDAFWYGVVCGLVTGFLGLVVSAFS